MAEKATPETETAPKSSRDNLKRVGADFSLEEYALIREARFVKRFDKDSEVIREAVNQYFERHGITLDKA
jgi:hypothetical protein